LLFVSAPLNPTLYPSSHRIFGLFEKEMIIYSSSLLPEGVSTVQGHVSAHVARFNVVAQVSVETAATKEAAVKAAKKQAEKAVALAKERAERDPYAVLGLGRAGASVAEIKRAYRALAKRHHPGRDLMLMDNPMQVFMLTLSRCLVFLRSPRHRQRRRRRSVQENCSRLREAR
jgi:hypothetical protein